MLFLNLTAKIQKIISNFATKNEKSIKMMNKKRMMTQVVVGMLATTTLLFGTTNVQAQTHADKAVNVYFTATEMPDMRQFMPAPPDTFGIQWTHDIMRYYWGKDQRIKDPERAKMAREDAESSIDWMMKEFSVPFGLQMSKEGTPEMYRLLKDATSTARKICTNVQKFYARKRPFLRFHE